MTPIYRKDVIANVPKRWKEQYFTRKNNQWYDAKRKATHDALDEKGGGLTGDQADAIIGNSSWTRLECDVCKKNDCDIVWRIGETPDYDSRWLDICPSCIAKMADKVKDTPQ